MANESYYYGSYAGGYDDLPMLYGQTGGERLGSLTSPRSYVRGFGLMILVISTSWGSYLQESGTGVATLMSYMSQFLTILLGCVVLASMAFTGASLKFTTEFLLFTGFLTWVLIGFPFALSGELAKIDIITQIKLLALALIVLNTVDGRHVYIWMLVGLMLAMIFASAGALSGIARGVEIVNEGGNDERRYSGTFGNANEAGQLACIGAWAAFSILLIIRSRFLKLILLSIIAWGVVIVAWTASKGAMIGLAAGMFAAYWFVLRKSSRGLGGKAGWLIVFAVVFGVLGTYFATTYVGERIRDFLETLQSGHGVRSDEIRQRLLLGSIEVFFENPIFGVGYGCVGLLLRPGGYISPHNTLTAMAACTGLPGWLLFFGPWLVAINRIRRLSKLSIPMTDYKLALTGWILFAMLGFWTLVTELQKFKPFWVCFAGLVAYLAWVERTYHQTTEAQE